MTSERTVVIVDDEAPARERLARLVDQLIGYRAIGSFSDGLEAIAKIESLQPDLALLDIAMPGISGIEVAKHLSGFSNAPAIIFCTAYDQYAIEAFDAGAVGYLMKPVRPEKLDQALASASRLSKLQLAQLPEDSSGEVVEQPAETLKVKSQRGVQLIPINEVLCFVADGKYVTAKHLKGESLLEESLNQLEQQFGEAFVRCHRAALVRVSSIEKLDRSPDGTTFLTLTDHLEKVPVSRRHTQQIKEILLNRG